MHRLSQNFNIVPLAEPEDFQSAGVDLASIHMGKVHRAAVIIMLGSITGNDTAIKAYSGASAGTKTTALAFRYRLSTADQGAADADIFGDFTTVVAATGLVFADSGNYNDRTIVIEVDAREMTEDEPWLTVEIDDGSASVLLLSAVAICEPRYAADDPATVLA
jgi:hypothetical protein